MKGQGEPGFLVVTARKSPSGKQNGCLLAADTPGRKIWRARVPPLTMVDHVVLPMEMVEKAISSLRTHYGLMVSSSDWNTQPLLQEEAAQEKSAREWIDEGRDGHEETGQIRVFSELSPTHAESPAQKSGEHPQQLRKKATQHTTTEVPPLLWNGESLGYTIPEGELGSGRKSRRRTRRSLSMRRSGWRRPAESPLLKSPVSWA